MTNDAKVARCIQVLRFMSQDWMLGGADDSYAADIRRMGQEAAESLDATGKRAAARIFGTIAKLLDAISAMDNRNVVDPDYDGPREPDYGAPSALEQAERHWREDRDR